LGVQNATPVDANMPPQAPGWFWQEADGRWIPYRPRDSDELDRIRGSGRQTALVGGKYKVDFQTMTQTNTHTGFQRPVYRSYGIGEASVIHAQPVPVSGVVAVGTVVA